MKIPGQSTHEYKNTLLTGLDLVPTFLASANATYPDTLKGIKLEPLDGKSIGPLLEQKVDEIHGDNETLPLEYFGAEVCHQRKLEGY